MTLDSSKNLEVCREMRYYLKLLLIVETLRCYTLCERSRELLLFSAKSTDSRELFEIDNDVRL